MKNAAKSQTHEKRPQITETRKTANSYKNTRNREKYQQHENTKNDKKSQKHGKRRKGTETRKMTKNLKHTKSCEKQQKHENPRKGHRNTM